MPVHEGAAQLFNATGGVGQTSFFGSHTPLPLGVGYAVVVGFGLFFALLTTLLVWSDITFGGHQVTSEEFTTAGRQIKTGLIAVDVVSHWTWAATLLQSSNVAFQYGISGPFWYAAGASVQILLFGILAVEVKRRAPTAHTILEIINARWGLGAHLTFFFFCILTNVVVTAMLFLGGAAVLNALTNMNIYAAAFLMPLGVVIYTVAGLKATFLSSYLHTVIIYVALCIFSVKVYIAGPHLGSPAKVWENLVALSAKYPVAGNREGSYLTMYSKGGLMFGIINLIGNFGAVFVDQAYWQTAIAARPSSAHIGYLLGGLMWFTIPFTLATTMGLGALALDLPINMGEAEAGLVAPALAVTIMGQGGALLIVIMVFMAVTSAGSAELIAVSSLVTYDVYRTYLNKDATGKDILMVSRVTIVVFGSIMGILASALLAMQISLGYVYLAMGVLIGSAVIPIACCLSWKKCTALGATLGASGGLVLGVGFWLLTAYLISGDISVASTAQDLPMLVGNLASIGSSGFILLAVSLMRPDSYDWESMQKISLVDPQEDLFFMSEESMQGLDRARKFIWVAALAMTFVLACLWPLFTLIPGVFDTTYFYVWVVVSVVWGMIATLVCTILPIWESWESIAQILWNMMLCAPLSTEDILQKWEQTKPVPEVPGGNPLVAQEVIAHKQKKGKSISGESNGSGSHEGTPKTLSPKTSGTSSAHLTLAARLTLQHLSSPSSSLQRGITRDRISGIAQGAPPAGAGPSSSSPPPARSGSNARGSGAGGGPPRDLRDLSPPGGGGDADSGSGGGGVAAGPGAFRNRPLSFTAAVNGFSSPKQGVLPMRAGTGPGRSPQPPQVPPHLYAPYPPGFAYAEWPPNLPPRFPLGTHRSADLAAAPHFGSQLLQHSRSAIMAGEWHAGGPGGPPYNCGPGGPMYSSGPQVPTSMFANPSPPRGQWADDSEAYVRGGNPGVYPPASYPHDMAYGHPMSRHMSNEGPLNYDTHDSRGVTQPFRQTRSGSPSGRGLYSVPHPLHDHAATKPPTPSAPMWQDALEIAPHDAPQPQMFSSRHRPPKHPPAAQLDAVRRSSFSAGRPGDAADLQTATSGSQMYKVQQHQQYNGSAHEPWGAHNGAPSYFHPSGNR